MFESLKGMISMLSIDPQTNTGWLVPIMRKSETYFSNFHYTNEAV